MLIECVPNFSEGRDLARVAEIQTTIARVSGIELLHSTSDPDHNRTVITFAGDRAGVIEAAVRAARKAAELIDLNAHRGVHPRVGALDVLPFVPLRRATMDDCVQIAREAGGRIWSELGIPVFFYQAAATRADRVQLENIRRGQFEGLREAVLVDENRRPDVGGPALHPTAGAVIAGARKLLIAWNVNLKTTDLEVAKSIARRIRASSGGFPAVKALGLPLDSRGMVQVSMNLTDFEKMPMHAVYSEICRMAEARGVEIAASELIGLIPRAALEAAAAGLMKLSHFHSRRVLENCLDATTVPSA